MRHVLTVASKEFKTFFQTPIGYIILFIFTLVAGWWFFYLGRFFAMKEASMRGLFAAMPWLFLVFAPAITMRLWAEERKTGTVEVLLTMPLKDFQIVLGKFLAAAGLIAVWLLCLTPLVLVVTFLGEPDLGPIWGGFLGSFLLGCSYAAIGLAASAFTENQIIALVLGVFGSFFMMLLGFEPVVAVFPDWFGTLLHNASLHTHFNGLLRGVVDSRDALYYVTFIGFFLVLNTWAVRRKKGGGVSVLMVAAIVILVNGISRNYFTRLDLTDDKRYTLSGDTKRVLARLDDKLRLTAFLSSDMPAQLSNLRQEIIDLVGDFEAFSGGNLHTEILDPSKSKEARELAESKNIPEIPVGAQDDTGLELKKAFLGMLIEFGDKEETIPAVQDTLSLEYDLVLRVDKITRKKDIKVGLQVNDPFGGMNIPGMQRPPSQDRVSSENLGYLKQIVETQFDDVQNVDLKSAVEGEIQTLVLANPEKLSEVQMYHLDQFLMRGGSLIVMSSGNGPASFGQGPPQSQEMRSPSESVADNLFSNYGFKINRDVVLDGVCAAINMPVRVQGLPFPISQPVAYTPFPQPMGDSINQDHPITTGLDRLVFLYPSSVVFEPKPGVEAVELVRTSHKASKMEDSFMMLSAQSLPDPEGYTDQYLLAGLVQGEFHSYFTARDLPAEVRKGAADKAKPSSPVLPGAVLPGGNALLGTEEPGETVLAKEKVDAAAAVVPPEEDAPVPAEDGAPEAGGDGDPGGGDVPGGGLVRAAQEFDPDMFDPSAFEMPDDAESDAAPAPEDTPDLRQELGFRDKSPANTRILVIGNSEFGTNDALRQVEGNMVFLFNAVNFLSTEENLSGLRARRLNAYPFEAPSDGKKLMCYLGGMGAVPILLIVLGVWVTLWRRVIRPGRARQRMAALKASGE